MPRVKRGVTARARHKKVLTLAKGYRGRRSRVYRVAKQAGQGPKPKLAAKIGVLQEIIACIDDDLPGLRDRALLLIGQPQPRVGHF